MPPSGHAGATVHRREHRRADPADGVQRQMRESRTGESSALRCLVGQPIQELVGQAQAEHEEHKGKV